MNAGVSTSISSGAEAKDQSSSSLTDNSINVSPGVVGAILIGIVVLAVAGVVVAFIMRSKGGK